VTSDDQGGRRIKAANSFLRQLRMRQTVPATSKHKNSVVVLAKHVSHGSVLCGSFQFSANAASLHARSLTGKVKVIRKFAAVSLDRTCWAAARGLLAAAR
jgi:hypothetical protein